MSFLNKPKLLIFFIISLILFGCTLDALDSQINTMQDVQQLEGKEVTVIGRYDEAIINKHRQNRVHMGHYQVRINDSLSVLLLPPFMKESKRSDDEVLRLNRKKVKVTGTISATTSMSRPSLENQPLTVNLPCFLNIKSIEVVE